MLKKYCGYCGAKLELYKNAAALNLHPLDGSYKFILQNDGKYAIANLSGSSLSGGGNFYIGELDPGSLTSSGFLAELQANIDYTRMGKDNDNNIGVILRGIQNAEDRKKDALSNENGAANKVARGIILALLDNPDWKRTADSGDEFGNERELEDAFKGVTSSGGKRKGTGGAASKARNLLGSGVNNAFNDPELMSSRLTGYLKSNGFLILRGIQNATSAINFFVKEAYKDAGKSGKEGTTRSYVLVDDKKKKEFKKAVKSGDSIANVGYVFYYADAELTNKVEPKEGEEDPNVIKIDGEKYSVIVADIDARM